MNAYDSEQIRLSLASIASTLERIADALDTDRQQEVDLPDRHTFYEGPYGVGFYEGPYGVGSQER